MTFEVFMAVVASVGGTYALANIYVIRSLRSYRRAEAMLGRVNENLEKLTESDVPVGVARLAFMLAATAGCGCYVRGIIYSHYLPSPLARLVAGGPRRNSGVEHDLFDLDKLDGEQRALFSDLVASVIVYDADRNPLSGWVFRRVMKAYGEPSFMDRADAEATAFSILSRKKPEKVPAITSELCAA